MISPGVRSQVRRYVAGRVDLAKKVLPIAATVRPELIPVATAVQLVPTRRTANPTVSQGLRSSIRDEQRAQVAYRSRRTVAVRSADKGTANLYGHITGEEKHHEVEFTRRLSKVGNRNPDKQPWQANWVEYGKTFMAGNIPLDWARIHGSHKGIVQQALSEGKPVPAEVLADYPDLIPKKRNPTLKKRSRGKTTNILMTLLIMGGILYLIRRNVE